MQQRDIIEGLPVFQTLDRVMNARDQKFALAESSKSIHNSLPDLMRTISGKPKRFPETIGTHPDFEHVTAVQDEFAPITSMFVDIKKSTMLNFKFSKRQVKEIKQSLLDTAAIVIQAFDGHVHRFHGDGLLAFFGRKSLDVESTTTDALNAASTLMILVETLLAEKMKASGLDPIKIRIGIDHDPEALWSKFGSKFCTEITACGLHVDLAAKLQAKASSNSVMIGDKIRELLDLPEEFLSVKEIKEDGVLKPQPLIINHPDLRYRMWDFDWRKFASYFSWPKQLLGNQMTLSQPNSGEIDLPLKVSVINHMGEVIAPYTSGMSSLPKGLSLRFELVKGLLPSYRSIEWIVENRGKEATDAKHVRYEYEEERNRTFVKRETAYLGHHIMTCRVTFSSGKISSKKVAIVIGREWAPALPSPKAQPAQLQVPRPSPLAWSLATV